MSEPLCGIVISHAALAKAFVDAVATITGIDDALLAVSNEGYDHAGLREQLGKVIADRPAVLFVDLPQGSCLVSAAQLAVNNANLAIVTGVNMAMLLDFVLHRDLDPQAAADRAIERGTRAIRAPTG